MLFLKHKISLSKPICYFCLKTKNLLNIQVAQNNTSSKKTKDTSWGRLSHPEVIAYGALHLYRAEHFPEVLHCPVTIVRSILQAGEGRHRDVKWSGQDHVSDSWQRSNFSAVQSTVAKTDVSCGVHNTAGQGIRTLLCRRPGLHLWAMGQTYKWCHQLQQLLAVICRSHRLLEACPQRRSPMRQTFSNCATQTTSNNWQALATLHSRSSQTISLFYCDLQHLQDPHIY